MSEFGFTSKLEGISDRVSSEYASKISSGMGGYPNSRLEGKVVMEPTKLKEIRQYVAHELYRYQKKVDDQFKEFEKV